MYTVLYGANGDIYGNRETGVRNGIWERIIAALAAKNGVDRDQYIDLINSTQRAHRAMRVHYGAPDNTSKWTSGNADVTSYQDLIKREFSFVNDPGVLWGFNQTGDWKYNIPEGAYTGDSPSQGWKSEGVWGALNDTRRILGRKIFDVNTKHWIDDWSPDELTKKREELAQYGLTMELEADPNDLNVQYYVLKKLNDPDTPGGKTPPGGTTPNVPRWMTKYFEKILKPNDPGWTDWMPLSQNLAINNATDARIGRLERMKAFPLKEATWHNYKITNDYFTLSALKRQATEARDRGFNLDLTSDNRANLKRQMAYEDKAQEAEFKGMGYKSLRDQEDRLKAMAVSNENTDNHVTIRNENAETLKAKFNTILTSRASLLEKFKKNLTSYVSNMYANAGEFLKTKRINAAKRVKSGIESTFNTAMSKAQDLYDQFLSNLFLGQNKTIIWNYLNSHDYSPGDDEGVVLDFTDLKNNFDAYANTEAGLQKILDYLAKSKQGTAWLEAARKKNEDTYKKSMYQARAAYDQGMANIPAMFTNQLWDEDPLQRYSSYTDPIFAKSGAKVDRLSDYYKLYLKERESVRRDARKREEDLSKDLNRALDRISKEELLLLRSVFK